MNQARESDPEPVLITPMVRMYPNSDTHNEHNGTVHLLATDMGVLLLSLEQKSRQVFDTYPNDAELHAKFGYDNSSQPQRCRPGDRPPSCWFPAGNALKQSPEPSRSGNAEGA